MKETLTVFFFFFFEIMGWIRTGFFLLDRSLFPVALFFFFLLLLLF